MSGMQACTCGQPQVLSSAGQASTWVLQIFGCLQIALCVLSLIWATLQLFRQGRLRAAAKGMFWSTQPLTETERRVMQLFNKNRLDRSVSIVIPALYYCLLLASGWGFYRAPVAPVALGVGHYFLNTLLVEVFFLLIFVAVSKHFPNLATLRRIDVVGVLVFISSGVHTPLVDNERNFLDNIIVAFCLQLIISLQSGGPGFVTHGKNLGHAQGLGEFDESP